MAGTYSVDYSRFHETVSVDTPLCSSKELNFFKKNSRHVSVSDVHVDVGNKHQNQPSVPSLIR
jgi:hypothetical protein